MCSFGTFLGVIRFFAGGIMTRTTFGGITMKTFVSLLVLTLATAFTAPAFAQETAAPATKADCEKAKGTWDDATSKCTLPK
jgi:hypothetical protein